MLLTEQTKNELGTLGRSPTFAMSLGAKELFHTNFLAFLLETNEESLDSLRCALRDALDFAVHDNELSTCAVWREKAHLDLIAIPLLKGRDEEPVLAENRALVVEAKLKSIPTTRQLKTYLQTDIRLEYPEDTKEFKRKIPMTLATMHSEYPALRLLTPSGMDAVHCYWSGVSWKAVANAIRSNADDISAAFKSILSDYADSLDAITSVVDKVRAHVSAAWQQRDTTEYRSLYDELTDAEFRRIRLHDLTGKVGFDALLSHIVAKLEMSLRGTDLVSYVHYSRSQPGLAIEVSAGGSYQLGIQVQGTQFRHFVSSAKDDPGLEERVLDTRLWSEWLAVDACGKPLRGYMENELQRFAPSKNGRLTNLRVFNAERFLYSAMSLSKSSLAELADGIEASISKAVELRPVLNELKCPLGAL